ncbi:hypothetical protein F4810DRAFT_686268 [Camillea tinctor]|nr:hypothetical protein F4810DRAFT_686268 [Camillea tinctor]
MSLDTSVDIPVVSHSTEFIGEINSTVDLSKGPPAKTKPSDDDTTSENASQDEHSENIVLETLKEIKSLEKSLNKLVGLEYRKPSEGLHDLIQSIALKAEALSKIQFRLADQFTKGSEFTSTLSPKRLISTCELKFSKWSSIPGNVEAEHPTIYILDGPAAPDDSKALTPTNCQIGGSLTTLQNLTHDRSELPELIVVKSMRLMIYLDWNICDGMLSWYPGDDGNTHFSILRPFKILVYLDKVIRGRLIELEEHRKAVMDMSEDEYDLDWKTNPPSDSINYLHKLDVQSQTMPEHTGLIKDLRILVKFMDHYITPSMSRGADDSVYFSDLWYIFPTGSLIYVKDKKVPQKIWKVIQRVGGRVSKHNNTNPGKPLVSVGPKLSQFVIDCYYIDFDGSRYIHVFHRFVIDPFDGRESITNLPVCPLQAAEDKKYINREAALDYGRNFIKCTRPSNRDYTGRNQLQKPNGEEMTSSDKILPENASRYSEWIDSEVMVDMERALHAVPDWRPNSLYRRFEEEIDLDEHQGTDKDSMWDRKSAERLMATEIERCQKWDQSHPPTEDEDLLLLPCRVFAFIFRTRKWACIKLGKDKEGKDMLRERQPRPEPWNHLELPSGHKEIVQSLIQSHIEGNAGSKLQFDLVRAKGKGVVILLHGVPGVGKTSTAECAAEANNRPLLPITCGDLGTSPREVEAKLQETFHLAQLWNCVLLLDEADVFLAQRSTEDIQRNALVSVFLRVLEYYEGILFLTSNRVGVFDEALKSRLHMALYYPPLKWKPTQRIWETHLKKLADSGLIDLEHNEILDYAEEFFNEQMESNSGIGPVWNGRQIRNAFQSAVALAGYKHQGTEKIELKREHFSKVAKVSRQFNNYLWSIHCKSDADKAMTWGIRHDRWAKPENTRGTMESNLRMERHGSIDGSGMAFGLDAENMASPYQQQTIPQGTQLVPGFPPHQHQGSIGTQSIPQGSYQHVQGQFGQQGIIQPQQQYAYQHQEQLLVQQQPGLQGHIQHQQIRNGPTQANTQPNPQYAMNLNSLQQQNIMTQQLGNSHQGVQQSNIGAEGVVGGMLNPPAMNHSHQLPS